MQWAVSGMGVRGFHTGGSLHSSCANLCPFHCSPPLALGNNGDAGAGGAEHYSRPQPTTRTAPRAGSCDITASNGRKYREGTERRCAGLSPPAPRQSGLTRVGPHGALSEGLINP